MLKDKRVSILFKREREIIRGGVRKRKEKRNTNRD